MTFKGISKQCCTVSIKHIIPLAVFHSEFVKLFFTVGKIPFRDPPTHSVWLSRALIQNSRSVSVMPSHFLPSSLSLLSSQFIPSLLFFSVHYPHLNPKTCFPKALVSDVQKAQWCLMFVTLPSKKAFPHQVSLFDTHNNPFFNWLWVWYS